MIWPIVIMCMLLAGIFYMRMTARAAKQESVPDTGLAILDFNRAFPDEAIRAIHATADGRSFFVRLHDGKAGFMQSQGAHYVCHLIEDGNVRVSNAPSGRGLSLHFTDFDYLDSVYEFRTPQQAAEVSLWLLGSFKPQSEFAAAPVV